MNVLDKIKKNLSGILMGAAILGAALMVSSVASATVFPSQQVGTSPVNGYYLQTNGVTSTWAAVSGSGGSGSGTVTSITAGHAITITPSSPLTATGTISVSTSTLSGTDFYLSGAGSSTQVLTYAGTSTVAGSPGLTYSYSSLFGGNALQTTNIQSTELATDAIGTNGPLSLAAGGAIGLNPGALQYVDLYDGDSGYLDELDTSLLSNNRDQKFQDKSGTFAYTSDNISEFPNDAGYINSTGTQGYFPYWLTGGSLAQTSSVFMSSSTNDIGIGTSTPSHVVDVYGNTSGGVLKAERTNAATSSALGTAIIQADTSGGNFGVGGGAAYTYSLSDASGTNANAGGIEVLSALGGQTSTKMLMFTSNPSGTPTLGLTLDQNGNATLNNTTISGNATATSLTVTGLATASGNPCLVVSATGAVSTSTCGSGGSGSVTTSSAVTAGEFPYWANATGGLSGTSTLFSSTSTGYIGIGTATATYPLTVVATATFSNVGTVSGDVGMLNVYRSNPATNDVLLKIGSSNVNNEWEFKEGDPFSSGPGFTAGGDLQIGLSGNPNEIYDAQAANNNITWWNASGTLSERTLTGGWVSIQPLPTLDTAIGYALTVTPSSTLDVGGSVGLLAVTTSSQSVTLGNAYLYLLNVTSTATATLPIVATAQNREYEVKDIGTAAVTIVPGTSTDYVYSNSATSTSYAIAPGQSVTLQDDSTYWQTIGEPSVLRGTSNALGGTLTGVGTCLEATGTVLGILPTMSVNASPATTTDIGDGLSIRAWASGANLATVEECSLLASITTVTVPFSISAIP